MNLLYLIPGILGSGFDVLEIERRKRVLQQIALKENSFFIEVSGEGTMSIESACDEILCGPSMIMAAKKAEERGIDGIIIGCAGDPCAEAMKEAVNIPVVGPAQASFALASQLGRRFSIITPLKETIGTALDLISKYGYRENFASVRSIDTSVLDIVKDRDMVKEHTAEAVKIAIREDKADVIVLGCMSIAFAGFDKDISQLFNIPVINPVESAVHTLETMIQMKVIQSRIAYPKWEIGKK